jgi:6-phosphogluconolactonase (cycloisomerase 2 family)
MSKKLGVAVALMAMCGLSLLLGCGSSSSRPSGLLYVLTQGQNEIGNNVSSFAIDLDSGNLSLINSNASTCAASSTCGLPLQILLDSTGATAFVLSQGAISSYPVNSDGSFGSPSNAWTATAGDTAIAMARDAGGSFLYVITGGNQTSNPVLAPQLLVFSTTPGSGTLTPVNNATSTLTRTPTGLSAISFTPPAGAPAACSTSGEDFVYVTSNHDLTATHNDNTVSVYCVDSNGNLTEQSNSPYATSTDPLSVLAVNTNSAGQNSGNIFVYVGSQPTSSGALSVFQMCTIVGNAGCAAEDVQTGLLLSVGGESPATGQDPIQMVVDPTNNFLYVLCNGTSQVYAYRINTAAGTLTAIGNAPTGSQPVSMALHPSVNNTGQFLFTSNSGSSNISAFALDTTAGSLSASPLSVTAPATPSGMAAR